MTTEKQRTSKYKVGSHRGRNRIYLEGKYLSMIGFERGCGLLQTEREGVVELLPCDDGRTISVSGKGSRDTLVIDVLTNEFAAGQEVQVHVRRDRILIRISKVDRMKSLRRRNNKAVSLFAGGGLLDEAAKKAGYETLVAVEKDSRYADVWQQNHDGHMINMGIEEAELPMSECSLLLAGVPCEPYSNARRSTGGEYFESHELGTMFYWFLRAVERYNPHDIVMENVPNFIGSVSFLTVTRVLAALGYEVAYGVLDSMEYGEVASRKRAVIVATTGRIPRLPEPTGRGGGMATVLDGGAGGWFSELGGEDVGNGDLAAAKEWPFRMARNNAARGSGFKPQVVDFNSPSCPTITKRYLAGQTHNVVVAHPTVKGVFRWLTVEEIRKLMGVPEGYVIDLPKTVAGEVLGQGVLVNLFEKVITALTKD